MKKVLKEFNIPTSQYAILDSFDNTALNNFHYPLVVKPVDCNSSKGVKKVFTEMELHVALESAILYSRILFCRVAILLLEMNRKGNY